MREKQKLSRKALVGLVALSLLVSLSFGVACKTVSAEEKLPKPGKIVPPTAEWEAVVQKAAPAEPTVKPDSESPKKVLVFSLFTGYDHKVIPHVDRVLDIIGKKSGIFDVTVTRDIDVFQPKTLSGYDILVLNNNCSVGPRRDLFLDELERNPKYKGLSEAERKAKAKEMEKAMLEFVRAGKGLVAIHGAPTMLNNSPDFTGMVGGAFDYHPPSQYVTVQVVDPKHPLTAAFNGKAPFIHVDEPYCFCGTYAKKDFRPLLRMETESLKDPGGKAAKEIRYVSWIKPYGKGRVFYCSPSHYPESYESPTLLRYLLDGMQYAAGDLKCDDSTPSK